MCPDLCSVIQRAGRAARTPGTEALFVYMAEKWAADKRIDQQSNVYVEDPDTPVRICSAGNLKSKKWVGMASVAFVNSQSCLRREFAKYLGDKSGDCGKNRSPATHFRHSTHELSPFDEVVLRPAPREDRLRIIWPRRHLGWQRTSSVAVCQCIIWTRG